MLPPIVLIDLEPEATVAAAELLSRRCTQVVASSGTGGCALEEATDPGIEPSPVEPRPPWLVRVTWSGEPMQSAQIDLFRSEATESPVLHRDLSFSLESPELDRWESVGLLIAALVVSARGEPPKEQEIEPVPSPPPPEPLIVPEPSEHAPSVRGLWALGALIGSGIELAPDQFGANLQAQLELPDAALRPLLQLGYGYTAGNPKLHQGWLALGAGLPVIRDPLEIEFYATLLGQLVHARAALTGATDSDTRPRWGGAAGVGVYPRLDPAWSIWLGAEGTLLTPRMVFEVQNLASGELRSLGWRGFLGLRWTP